MLKKSRLREPFRNQHGKRARTLFHSGRQQLYHIYWSMWRRMSWKMALLALCKILGLFVTTLTADDKYSLLNRDNLTQPIQILVPQKQKTFSQFLSAFLKTIWNFKHFQTKDDSHSRCISEITDSWKVLKMSKKSRFRGSFNKQHFRRPQTLLHSERQHLYHSFWSLWR